MMVCLIFVCYSLISLSLQVSLRNLAEKNAESTSASTTTVTTGATENSKGLGRLFIAFKRSNCSNYSKIADTIEKVSFYAYPISFLMFVIIYWLVSLSLGGRNPFTSNYEPTKPGVVTVYV